MCGDHGRDSRRGNETDRGHAGDGRECVITTCEPGRELTFERVFRDAPSTRWQYRFEPSDGGTRATESYVVLSMPRWVRAMRRVPGRTGSTVTIAGVANAAAVSRSWLYEQPDTLEHINRLGNRTTKSARIPTTQRAFDESPMVVLRPQDDGVEPETP